MNKKSAKVLYLAPDPEGVGGIQGYNRRILEVLEKEGIDFCLVKMRNVRLSSKIKFVFKYFSRLLFFRPDITWCGHINFSPLCLASKKVFGANYILNTYGIEVLNLKKGVRVKALKNALIINYIAEYIKGEILKKWPEVESKLFLLPNPVEEDRFTIRPKSAELIKRYNLENKKVILTVARLSEKERSEWDNKGYDRALKALPLVLEKIPEAKYILVGGGEDSIVDRLINELRLRDNVITTGRVSDKDLVEYYNLADVFVMPSKFEGFGIVFLESLACGRPIIASKGFGSEAILQNKLFGLAVNPDSAEEISEAIVKILSGGAKELGDREAVRNEMLRVCGCEAHKQKVKNLILLISQKQAKDKKFQEKSETQLLSKPGALPGSKDEVLEWQEENRAWWENNPMRYDWKEDIEFKELSKQFYLEVDKRFFSNSREYLPWKNLPFEDLIDFKALPAKDVLEIGVGAGSHAQLLAEHAKLFTGIDITEYAVKTTRERLRLFNLKGRVLRMDAEKLEFEDDNFDFVWSWGVIHHSANTLNIIKEIHRALRPGGMALVMVYHRGWWNYYITGLLRALVSGNLFKMRSLHKSIQAHTDGALARYYTVGEWNSILRETNFLVEKIFVSGPKSDVLPIPAGRIKNAISPIFPNYLNRFLAAKLKMGSFLISLAKKPL